MELSFADIMNVIDVVVAYATWFQKLCLSRGNECRYGVSDNVDHIADSWPRSKIIFVESHYRNTMTFIVTLLMIYFP